MGRRGLLDRTLEQWRVVAQDAEAEAVRPELLHAVRRRRGHRIAAQAEREYADVRDRVTTASARAAHPPHIDAVCKGVERAIGPADLLQPAGVVQLCRTAALRMLMVQMLHPAEQAVELHRPSRPVGRIAGEILEQGKCALASTRIDRVGDIGTRCQHVAEVAATAIVSRIQGGRLRQQAVAEQVAEVRHHPVVAGFNEPVFVQPRDVLLQHVGLGSQHAQEIAQRVALVGIAHAVDHRQQVIQSIRLRAHGVAPCSLRAHGVASCSSSVSGMVGDR